MNNDARTTLNECELFDNRAGRHGGAIYVDTTVIAARTEKAPHETWLANSDIYNNSAVEVSAAAHPALRCFCR